MTEATFRTRYDVLRRMVDRRLAALKVPPAAADLRDGCRYVLDGKGKRVRAVLVLLSCEAVGGNALQALDAGTALEVMHNFTLVHDDIMDHAPSRRGRPTVHIRWDLNTALLVGDVLLGAAFAALLRTRTRTITPLVRIFTEGLLQVCEGQALDLAYERRTDVTLSAYFRMIEKKTARLLALAAELGGMIGGATPRQRAALRRYGLALGRAFQLQDDLLDVTADHERFGKETGGDILARKKTFLLLTALERARGDDGERLRDYMLGPSRTPAAPREEVLMVVTDIYRRYGVIDETRQLVLRNTQKARRALTLLPPSRGTSMLRHLADALVSRSS
jgi:geranylgeranyl diphosphate synthase type II